jgi:hypothetical protein
MNCEQKARVQIPASGRRHRLAHATEQFRACRGRMTISLGFYLGIAMVLLLVIGGALVAPAARPLIDQHANPKPATRLPTQVLVSPDSHLYHVGSCPYLHQDSKPLSTWEALRHGLVPCPYCIGNSSARLTPTVISRQAH